METKQKPDYYDPTTEQPARVEWGNLQFARQLARRQRKRAQPRTEQDDDAEGIAIDALILAAMRGKPLESTARIAADHAADRKIATSRVDGKKKNRRRRAEPLRAPIEAQADWEAAVAELVPLGATPAVRELVRRAASGEQLGATERRILAIASKQAYPFRYSRYIACFAR